ncbi:hypothetical protein Lal_00040950 [Lupinus albus]|uniref:RING-type E3 ubiquitin transferase n=1 Tax=Lupinus albus TaxID=3870 RepID=A0A6A4PKP2_LUPAL|nr:putative aminoacyltransferase, E1 ubiquitin-activating enzyme [Lupinus albus]KAF1887348.1 hypothetical protein Lal_00040950 [Lupinus albus]
MADVTTYDDLDSITLAYFSHSSPDFNFDFYSSEPEFPPTLEPDSNSLFDRHNQINFPNDIFHQCVDQSQVIGHGYFVTDLGFGVERGGVSISESNEAPFHNCVCVTGLGSDSDEEEEESEVLENCVNSDEEYNDVNDGVSNIPLCWDSLQLDEDNKEIIENFEWEEVDVDGRVDEIEVLSMLTIDDDRLVSVSGIPVIEEEEEDVSVVRMGRMENLEWEVLLNANNLNTITSPDLDNDDDLEEPYFSDHDEYIYASDYEMMFGQFVENGHTLRPPASVSIVRNLPSVVVTKEDVDNNNALCAVCKDDFAVAEQAKELPCLHRCHGNCIVPWLAIRNTCPVCRYDFPTDDADYERMRANRSAPRM